MVVGLATNRKTPTVPHGREEMKPEEKTLLLQWMPRIEGDVTIHLTRSDHPASKEFEAFTQDLIDLGMKVDLQVEREEGAVPPAIRIHPRICYRIVPEGQELPPFLEAIAWIAGGSAPAIDPVAAARIGSIQLPALFRLFVANACPHCPKAVRQLIALCLNAEPVYLDIVDAFRFASAEDRIQSVPTLVLEGGFRWSGAIDLQEVIDTAVNRDPMGIGLQSLENLVSDGQVDRIVGLMKAHRGIPPALVDLLVHPQWQIRLGAMVTVETLAADMPELARMLADPIWSRFSNVEDRIKGDLLYVMGEIGADDYRDRILEFLSRETNPEVIEAAQEALEKIGG